jgi:hypothetical protein
MSFVVFYGAAMLCIFVGKVIYELIKTLIKKIF